MTQMKLHTQIVFISLCPNGLAALQTLIKPVAATVGALNRLLPCCVHHLISTNKKCDIFNTLHEYITWITLIVSVQLGSAVAMFSKVQFKTI